MNKMLILAGVGIFFAGAIGYAAGEYDGDIIEPSAKYIKGRTLDVKGLAYSNVCGSGNGISENEIRIMNYRYKPFLQGVERIAVYFDYNNRGMNEHIACVDGKVEEICKDLGYKDFKPLSVEPSEAEKKNQLEAEKKSQQIMPSFYFEAINEILSAYIESCKRDIPISLHYLDTDDEFYRNGTLALHISVYPNSRKNIIGFASSLYRPDVGFHYFGEMETLREEIEWNEKRPKDILKVFQKHINKHLY